MAIYATLGQNIVFETLTSPESFRSVSEYHYAEHKVVEARPRLQWIANELQTITMEMGFHRAFTNPSAQMQTLRSAAEAHLAMALIFGNGGHRGYFVIEKLEETFTQQADDGSYVAIGARVDLKEWVPGADFDPFAPARPSFSAPALLFQQSIPILRAPTYTPPAPTLDIQPTQQLL